MSKIYWSLVNESSPKMRLEVGSRQGQDNKDYGKELRFFFFNMKTLDGFMF